MESHELCELNVLLERDAELQEKIKGQVVEMDKKIRSMTVPLILDQVRVILSSLHETTAALASLIPPNQIWRWKDMWGTSMRNAVFSTALVEFLSRGELISLGQTSDVLGIKEEWSDRFALSVEDYLHGLVSLVNELSRLAINSVTLGNFDMPIQISLFVRNIFVGFSMLNLKNDLLRKRFDSLKYDIKKIEEVVYDITLRDLANRPSKLHDTER